MNPAFSFQVIAFCSDSEAKMVLTRKKLEERFQQRSDENENQQLFVYGCAAHFLNLVESEVSPRTVLSKIVEVQTVGASYEYIRMSPNDCYLLNKVCAPFYT